MSSTEIKQLRLRLKLTQADFAHLLGVSCPTVNRWENGRARASQLAVAKINAIREGLNEKD